MFPEMVAHVEPLLTRRGRAPTTPVQPGVPRLGWVHTRPHLRSGRGGPCDPRHLSPCPQQQHPPPCRYGVHAYFCGHDHNLQHIHAPARRYHQASSPRRPLVHALPSPPPKRTHTTHTRTTPPQVVSGAGSKVSPEFYRKRDSPFQYPANGFVAVRMARESMALEFQGLASDAPLYSVDVPRALPAPPRLPGGG